MLSIWKLNYKELFTKFNKSRLLVLFLLICQNRSFHLGTEHCNQLISRRQVGKANCHEHLHFPYSP